MGGWFSKKSSEEDYEQVLAAIAVSINSRQQHLSEIRLRERRATLLCTIYALGIWGLYVGVWYLGLLAPTRGGREFAGRGRDRVQEAVRAIPVFVGPILVLFMRRIVQWWYHRVEGAEEKELRKLVKEQRTKIEEIKKKTNYYSTRNLLDRYDAPAGARPDPNQQLRQRPNAGPPGGQPGQPGQNPTNGATPAANGVVPPGTPNAAGASATKGQPLPGQLQPGQLQDPSKPGIFAPAPLVPPTPPRKQWYDRVADALLGDDAPTGGGGEQRYALICEKCFMHNGLVREDMFEDAQYMCPRCGHFNASVRAKKFGTSGVNSVASSMHASPVGFSGLPQGHVPGMPHQPHIEALLHPGSKVPRRRSPSPGPLPASPLRFSHEMSSYSPPASPPPGVDTSIRHRSVSPVAAAGTEVDQ